MAAMRAVHRGFAAKAAAREMRLSRTQLLLIRRKSTELRRLPVREL
jgi:hypothetical protein